MTASLHQAGWEAFDAACAEIAALDSAALARDLASCPPAQRWETLRFRWRHRLDEFADIAMRPVLARRSAVSDPGELDDVFYTAPVYRVGYRPWTTQRIVMTGRGVGKTTRQKIRCFHGLLYGCRRVSVAIAQSDPDATGWIRTVRDWAENPGPELALLFPELRSEGNEHVLRMLTRYGAATLIARGFKASMRGINELSGRPDALDLDDIESEDTSMTERARDNNQRRLLGKVLPLAPLEGGAEVWWTQTPVHHDCMAVRAYRGTEELRGWETRRIPIIRQWPDNAELWEECRRIYFDVDTYGSRQAAKLAARAFYEQRREAMDAGADVLDPMRMGVFACHARKWDVGPTAFAREYEMSVSAAGGGKLAATSWPTFRRRAAAVEYKGRAFEISAMRLEAHYDSSDGGDDGALVIVGEHPSIRGRLFVLLAHAWEGAPLSRQISELPSLLKPYHTLGLRRWRWEPTAGSASLVRDRIEAALRDDGLGDMVLVDKHSTERKEARIIGTLEPLGAAGLLTLDESIPYRLKSLAEDFDDSRHDNADDWLDALQRAVEAHIGEEEDETGPDPREVLEALDRGDW